MGCSFILHSKKTAFIVEHDFIMATYLADRVVLYTGIPALDCVAHEYVLKYANNCPKVYCGVCCSFLYFIMVCIFRVLFFGQTASTGDWNERFSTGP